MKRHFPISIVFMAIAALAPLAHALPPPVSAGRAFGYAGADLDDSASVRRTFVWFAGDGAREASFVLDLPRNADRLVETELGNHYVRPVDLIMAEYTEKPFLWLWGSGFPVSVWPSPEDLPYARRLGAFRDGVDTLVAYAVAREEVAGKTMAGALGFDAVRLSAREVPDGTGTRMRVTDLIARLDCADRAALGAAVGELRKYWTGKNTNHIFHQYKERDGDDIRLQDLLVFEDKRKGVFIHWEKASGNGGYTLYMVLTDKWGYKGGVDSRGRPAAPADESPGAALLRGARENNRELVAAALAKGADPNFADERNITPLGIAVEGMITPDTGILWMLLDAGADPECLWGNAGTTPFYYLVQSATIGKKSPRELAAYAAAIRLMIRHGADVNRKQGFFGSSPLAFAVSNGADPELVRILVEDGKGIVTEKMLDSAKDNPRLLECLAATGNPSPLPAAP